VLFLFTRPAQKTTGAWRFLGLDENINGSGHRFKSCTASFSSKNLIMV